MDCEESDYEQECTGVDGRLGEGAGRFSLKRVGEERS
jgi:hypothetical protein